MSGRDRGLLEDPPPQFHEYLKRGHAHLRLHAGQISLPFSYWGAGEDHPLITRLEFVNDHDPRIAIHDARTGLFVCRSMPRHLSKLDLKVWQHGEASDEADRLEWVRQQRELAEAGPVWPL